MVEKVFITGSKKVTFSCPECENARVVDLDQHNQWEKADRIKVRCGRCGHTFRVVLEKRAQYRKAVNFSGSYARLVGGRPVAKGRMKVVDLSRTGLKLKLNETPNFMVGDILQIEFHLDDAKQSLIKKEVEIKKIFGQELGVAFTSMHPSNPSDKALGFYMFG
jgi:predicted Zn finger-like uncharacterized protein